ncbi:MAG: S-layer homology domain-containing protein [Oscillospiraceae bacterium]|nr:S-layer homology domain-containing protein [Oscillospiraceae bacterium]
MRKTFRAIALLVILILLCTGCASVVLEGSVSKDGSGTVSATAGMPESLLYYAYEQAEANAPTGMSFEEYLRSDPDMEDFAPYTYNGEVYWGLSEELSFASPEELNTILFTDDNGMPDGSGSLVRDANGAFVLTLNLTRSTMEENSGEALTKENILLAEEISKMVPIPMHFIFTFPDEIVYTSGAADCMTVSGNSVLVDLFAASVKLESGEAETLSFVFSTAKSASGTPTPSVPSVQPHFSDVPATAWYTTAVNALAEGGLVNGVGGGLFAPDRTLSVSEFAQILARASGMEVGAGASGYWAEKALESCVTAGYIRDRGAISKENYEVPIERQEAVAAMQRAGKRTPTGTLTEADIPDFASIDPTLRADILAAYNSGVTSGTDNSRTFVPTGLLTRAQVCQLFYNLDWVAPIK